MKEKSGCFRWGIVAGSLALLGICLLGGWLFYASQRARSFNLRPLVLIHSPLNHDQMEVGERALVHATARADNGLTRLELWVDDALVAVQDAPESHPTSLVLSTDWMPTLVGNHVLVVRAMPVDGVGGQSTVMIEAFESGQSGAGTHLVEEGETLESIAGDHGTTPEDLDDLNPDLDPGGPVPGDELIVPDDEPLAEAEDGALEGGDEAPGAEDDPPGSVGIFEGIFGVFELFSGESERVTLRLEIPALRTWEAHDDLHCYVELAGSPPQWYPDIDSDQSTDESFGPLNHGWWDSASHLEGESAPVITWLGDQPLPLTISCVGIAAGVEAFELGRTELSIPPEDWSGGLNHASVDGAEGHYAFDYRVTQLEDAPRGVPMYLDPEMTPPTNARLDDRRISLRWDYNPESDEEPIDGFRIYLNGNLQWVEPPDERESGLPYEWFNPPCDSTYTFAVTAFRIGFPDGPESLPAIAIQNQPPEDCTREIQIIFQTLETYDLGGDGRYEDRHGDIGPPYGHFFANEKQITFDARPSGGGGGLDLANGLSHNTVYDLSEMSADRTWGFNAMNSTIVDVPFGGTFEFGFHIMDQDTGRCRDSNDRGCDDLICEGMSMIYEDNYGLFDEWQEGSLLSDNGRCRVAFTWGPAFGSPVGSGEPGWEPLPWLSMTDFIIDEATGRVQIEVRNTGRATWPWKDLKIALQTRAGEAIGVYTWTEFVLETGASRTLEHPDMALNVPFDACVVIDPFDEVLEEYERSGALFHNPICPQLPDLSIVNAYYASDGGRLRVAVENVGDAPLENRTLALETLLPDGSPLYLAVSRSNITIEPREIRTFDLPGVDDHMRERMASGYSVVVDPDETISEISRENNTHHVRGTSTIFLRWCDTVVPHYFGWGHNVRLDLTASAIAGSSTSTLLTDHRSDYFSYIYIDDYDTHYVIGDRVPGMSCIDIGSFEILGDEQLQVRIAGEYQAGDAGSWDNLNAGTGIFLPEDNWEADIAPECSGYDYRLFDSHAGWHRYSIYPSLGMLVPQPWSTNFHLCLEE